MNLGPIGGLLGKVLPILNMVGLNPAKLANKMGRDQLRPRFDAAVAPTVARLEKDGLTPAVKATSPEGERQLIRSAMYNLAKNALPFSQGASLVADFLRDQHDDKVVELAAPQINPTMTTAQAVEIVKREFFERIF